MPDPPVPTQPPFQLPPNTNQGWQDTGGFYPTPNDPGGQVQLALLNLQNQMPKESAGVGSVTPNPNLPPGTQATTDTFGNIQYQPSAISPLQSNVNDMMAHELTHVGQTQSLWDKAKALLIPQTQPYAQQPREQEAFATEARRQGVRKDINLPPDTPPINGLKNAGPNQ